MFAIKSVKVGDNEFKFRRPSFGQRLEMIRIIETAQAGKANADVVDTMVSLVNSLKASDDEPDWTQLLDWDQGMQLLMEVAAMGKASEDDRKNSESPR